MEAQRVDDLSTVLRSARKASPTRSRSSAGTAATATNVRLGSRLRVLGRLGEQGDVVLLHDAEPHSIALHSALHGSTDIKTSGAPYEDVRRGGPSATPPRLAGRPRNRAASLARLAAARQPRAMLASSTASPHELAFREIDEIDITFSDAPAPPPRRQPLFRSRYCRSSCA